MDGHIYIYIYIYIFFYAVFFEHFIWVLSVHLFNKFFLFISKHFNIMRDLKFPIRHFGWLKSSEIWSSVARLVVLKFSKNRSSLILVFYVLMHFFMFWSWSNLKFIAFSPVEILFTLIITHHYILSSTFFFHPIYMFFFCFICLHVFYHLLCITFLYTAKHQNTSYCFTQDHKNNDLIFFTIIKSCLTAVLYIYIYIYIHARFSFQIIRNH
jgi:hypothetical protein